MKIVLRGRLRIVSNKFKKNLHLLLSEEIHIQIQETQILCRTQFDFVVIITAKLDAQNILTKISFYGRTPV